MERDRKLWFALVVVGAVVLCGAAPARADEEQSFPAQKASAQWPIAENERPLTLRQSMAEFEGGLVADASKDRVGGHALSFTGDLRIGLTDRLTLTLGAPRTLCSEWSCTGTTAPYGAGLTYALFTQQAFELAPFISSGSGESYGRRDSATVALGFVARARVGALSLRLLADAEVGRLSDRGGSEIYTYRVQPTLALQLGERLSLDASLPMQAEFSHPDFFQNGSVALQVGGTVALSHQVDLRAFLSFDELVQQGPIYAFDRRSLGFTVAYRL